MDIILFGCLPENKLPFYNIKAANSYIFMDIKDFFKI